MVAELYPWIKLLHVASAALSITGFTVRGALKLRGSPILQRRWVSIAPHINDSVLLACAIYLSLQSQQYPGTSAWLTAKLAGLLLYIVLGMAVMRFASSRRQQLFALLAAQLSFGYIVAVALTRDPWPL